MTRSAHHGFIFIALLVCARVQAGVVACESLELALPEVADAIEVARVSDPLIALHPVPDYALLCDDEYINIRFLPYEKSGSSRNYMEADCRVKSNSWTCSSYGFGHLSVPDQGTEILLRGAIPLKDAISVYNFVRYKGFDGPVSSMSKDPSKTGLYRLTVVAGDLRVYMYVSAEAEGLEFSIDTVIDVFADEAEAVQE